MNQTLNKAQMKRARLRNSHLKNKSVENKITYNRRRSYCVFLLQKTTKEYFPNLNEKNTADCKIFWETIEPLLSGKTIWSLMFLMGSDDIIKEGDGNPCFKVFYLTL